MAIARVFYALLAILVLACPAKQIVRCQSDEEAVASEVIEGAELGIIGDDTHVVDDTNLGSAPGISTVCLFPKNPRKLAAAGDKTELLVGLHNEGDSVVKVANVHATLHLPFDHRVYSQNLTLRAFSDATVPVSAQATFPYTFYLSNLLQAGSYDLVGYIVYEIDEQLYQSVFHNGTIEVVESDSFLSIESLFLFTLGVAIIGFLGLWLFRQMQQYSKKTKTTPKVEVGTRQTEANMDEWLAGTAYAKSVGKEKKRK
ncbi:Translocon-associated protein subunit alpha [Rhynchospora pubera]|uniref:Translocon-associated protein subunit alpha n=1 Tax=Rhynchospora pubera TaxID=906938 RepID=A0AAV8E5C1_9POAL|nr:Translocon-associated protein subunit alpha [Rhynchospora pubera]